MYTDSRNTNKKHKNSRNKQTAKLTICRHTRTETPGDHRNTDERKNKKREIHHTHRTRRKESENIQQEIPQKKNTRDVKRREKKKITKQQHMYTDSTKHNQKNTKAGNKQTAKLTPCRHTRTETPGDHRNNK